MSRTIDLMKDETVILNAELK